MNIERIDLFHVSVPLARPFRTSFGQWATIESVLVRLFSGAFAGWGEAAPGPMPDYCPEYAAGVFALVRDVLTSNMLIRIR